MFKRVITHESFQLYGTARLIPFGDQVDPSSKFHWDVKYQLFDFILKRKHGMIVANDVLKL